MSSGSCPKCPADMGPVPSEGLPIASCKDCGGTWVDVSLLDHLPEKNATADELVRVFTELASQELEKSDRTCVQCSDTLLLGSYGGVEVDACRRCRGFFLDAFELEGVMDPNTTHPCPKCEAPMRSDEADGVPIHSCSGCEGRWLDVPHLEHALVNSRRVDLARDVLIRTFTTLTSADAKKTEYGCPSCEENLVAADHEGIELDLCFPCRGLFLDLGEMNQVTAAGGVPESTTAKAVGSLFRAVKNVFGR